MLNLRMIVNNPEPYADYLTLIPSAIAIIISSIALYYQFFNDSRKLIFNYHSTAIINRSNPLSFSIVLANGGNTDILITNFLFWIIPKKGEAVRGFTPDQDICKLPAFLKPGEIRIFKLISYVNLIDEQISLANEVTNDYTKFIVKLQIDTILSNGHKNHAVIDLLTINFNNDQNRSYGASISNKISAINMLSRKYRRKLEIR